MKFYWGLGSIPELADLPKLQRKRLWRTCLPAGLRIPRVWIGYGMLFVLLMIGIMGPRFIPALSHSLMLGIAWGGFWGGLGGFISNQVLIRALRPLLAARRAAMAPQPAHNDGSYHVPPAY